MTEQELLYLPWRTGIKQRELIYAVVGDTPGEHVFIGSTTSVLLTESIVIAHNDRVDEAIGLADLAKWLEAGTDD